MGSYAGVDWAADKHDVRVADETGQELLAATFAHDEAGLRSLCRQLVRLKVELVAIERPDGLLVERLLDAGLRVLPLHPNQVAATRARFRVSGGKSDRFDAFVLSELARTDQPSLPAARSPTADETKALRALTRAREDLVRTRWQRATSCAQSPALLARPDWPVLRIWTARSRSRSWRATRARPTRAVAGREAPCRRSLPASVTAGRQQPAQLLAKLRRAPQGRVGEDRAWSARRSAGALSGSRRSRCSGRRSNTLERQIATSIRHPSRRRDLHLAVQGPGQFHHRRRDAGRDGRLPPRATPPATRSPATPARPRSRSNPANARQPASAGGANKRLRSSFCRLADSTRHWHPWAQDLYAPSPRPRPRPPPRATHPRPRLVSHRVALLARRCPV